MKIEQEVPANYLRNNRHKAVVNILFTSLWLGEKIKAFLKEESISVQQYNILRILQLNDKPLSTITIRQMMLDRMSDTSRIVLRMLSKGLVNKGSSKNDKRKVDITISQKGVQVLLRLEKKISDLDSIINGLTDDEIDQLNLLLDKTRES